VVPEKEPIPSGLLGIDSHFRKNKRMGTLPEIRRIKPELYFIRSISTHGFAMSGSLLLAYLDG